MKPTRKPDKVTLERIYRKVLAIEKSLGGDASVVGRPSLAFLRDIGWGARKDITDLRIEMRDKFESLKGIVDHCQRLLREKQTLMHMIGDVHVEDLNTILREANAYMSKPIGSRGVSGPVQECRYTVIRECRVP